MTFVYKRLTSALKEKVTPVISKKQFAGSGKLSYREQTA